MNILQSGLSIRPGKNTICDKAMCSIIGRSQLSITTPLPYNDLLIIQAPSSD
ncbi:hypothetical protein [Spirosoma aerophilum]